MSDPSQISLSHWSWQSFVASTLVPLLAVEVVLLGAYAAISIIHYNASVSSLQASAQGQVRERADSEARAIQARLNGVEQQVQIYASQSGLALQTPFQPPAEDIARYTFGPDGSYILANPPEGAAGVFYSGAVPIGPDGTAKALRTAQLDPLMTHVVSSNPLVAQVYLNTWDSMNRIYPPVDLAGFPAKMDIPTYNFYYMADEAHNPDRGVVWTEAYLDPAGAGWITSAVAPVYVDDHLEAVAGFDITLDQLIDSVLEVDLPWNGYAILVDAEGSLLALPPKGEADFGIRELTQHDYSVAIDGDTPKPAEYDLFHRPHTEELARNLLNTDSGIAQVSLNGDRLVSWRKLEGPGWYLVLVAPTEQINASADQMWDFSARIGLAFLTGIILFYLCFLWFLYRRSLRQVAVVTQPLAELRDVVRRMAEGAYGLPAVRSDIVEIDAMAADVVAMGRTLGHQLTLVRDKQAALEEANEREAAAHAAMAAKTTFLAHVSHEIRTPMNGVLGTLELMERDGLTSEQSESLDVASRSGTALLALIDDLLEVSRLRGGSFDFESVPFDLRRTLTDSVALFMPSAHAKGVEIELELNLGPDGALGDSARLQQILSNLISNALKFTAQGRVLVRATRRDEDVQFEIEDTGIGIPQDRLSAIFDAFTQADVTTTRKFGGTGLGLTISQALVDRMGGTLRVESEEERGTVFRFSLPLPEAQLPNKDLTLIRSIPASFTQAASLRVLVAEDNPVNQTIARKMLERLGHTAVVVGDGVEAVEAASTGDFDLILMDVHMPRMDGRQAASHLRSEPSTAHLPILALTASVTPEDVRQCRDAGMDLVISKPISLAKLEEALMTAMAGDDRCCAAWQA